MGNQKCFQDISSKNNRGNQKDKNYQNKTRQPVHPYIPHQSIPIILSFRPSISPSHRSTSSACARFVHHHREKSRKTKTPRKLLEPRQPPSNRSFYFLYQPLSVFFSIILVLSPFRESHQTIKPRRRERPKGGGLTPNPPGNQTHQSQTPHQNDPQNRQPHSSTA